ncbi:MAG: hypothetical protein ACKVT0_09505 [Planctomycetaceae bacterium]
MPSPYSGEIDLLKELRLRRWARENYVAINERKSSWHPLVLDEMCRRDAELDHVSDFNPGQRFVPLEPTPHRAVHPAHPAPGLPNLEFGEHAESPRRQVAQHSHVAAGLPNQERFHLG